MSRYRTERAFMEAKLLELNPHWDPSVPRGFSYAQLSAVYNKELRRCVAHIRHSLGLN